MEKIWKNIYLCITESLFCSAEIKPNIVNQLYFEKIFWSKFKKELRGLSGLWTSRWSIGIPGGRSDQRLKEPSYLLIMKKTMKAWWEILSEAWPAGIEGSPGYFSSSLPDSALFSTQFFKLISGCPGSSWQCTASLLRWLLLLQSVGSGCMGFGSHSTQAQSCGMQA